MFAVCKGKLCPGEINTQILKRVKVAVYVC